MIKSVKGLKVGQDFFYQGIKYVVKSFPDRNTVIGKCTKILPDYPLTIKVELCDIKRQPAMTIEEKRLFKEMMDNLLLDPGLTYYDLAKRFKSYLGVERYNPRKVISCMSKVSGVSMSDIKGSGRKDIVILPRHLCFYYLWKQGAILQDIGNCFSRKDHATVLAGRNKIAAWIKMKDKKATGLYEKFLIEMEKV